MRIRTPLIWASQHRPISRSAFVSRPAPPFTTWRGTGESASSCWAARTITIPASTTASLRSSRVPAIPSFPKPAPARWQFARSPLRGGSPDRHHSAPLDISDVWKHTFSASSNYKLWAAKFVARHPSLIPVELSNFKCGHDAFISRVIDADH